jgi:hypothetical protein
MYRKMKQPTMSNNINLDSVLQQINRNTLPPILLLIILIITVFVIIVSDYFSFSKKTMESFDLPNINEDLLNQYKEDEKYKAKYNDNYDEKEQYDKNKDHYDKNKQQYDKYKEQYDKYKDSYNEYKKTDTTLNDYKKGAINYKQTFTKYKDDFFTKLNEGKQNIQKNLSNNINLSIPTIKDKKIANSLIIISFILIVLILCFAYLPGFTDFGKLFNQISNVTYVILYTIFIILFFRLLPDDVMKNNASYVVPITMIFAFILFIISFQSNYVLDYNLNYERIKMIIMYFCFITLCITYYSTDPGNYITKNFNTTSLLLVMLLGILGFVYLIILFTLPITSDVANTTNILKNVSFFSKYGSALFILFLIVITALIANYPGGFFKNKTTPLIVIPLLLVICIIWSVLLISNMFSDESANLKNPILSSKLSAVKKALLALLGFSISAIIIAYIVYNINNLSGRKGIISFVLSMFLIISILTLIYKTFFVTLPSNNANKSKNGFFELIINLIFYIPCLFSGLLDTIMKIIPSGYDSTATGNILLFIIVIGCLISYLFMPKIQRAIRLQGGKEFIDKPLSIDKEHAIANYMELNGSDKSKYQYSISFWLFIDSNAPNTNPSYNKFTSVLNYGGKPNILYKADTNTLMITVDQKDLDKKSKNQMLEFDENGNRIIYVNKNFLLQKWNNIIINYNGGTLDIFLNSELVKSSIEVVPYRQLDLLKVGSDSGINGAINNLVYYKNPLSISKIYHISM